MSLREICPCDISGVCPYMAESFGTCEYWCGEEEPQDNPEEWEEESPEPLDYDDYSHFGYFAETLDDLFGYDE